MPETTAQRFQQLAHQMRGYSMIGLLIAWKVFDPIFDPIFSAALKALYPGHSYGP
jgi:hypothetical protein